MHQPAYLTDQIDAFLKAHPTEQGWKVYECHDPLASKVALWYLVDFLRDRNSHLQRRFALSTVDADDLRGIVHKSHEAIVGSEWDLLKELDGRSWKGVIELEWQGQPLHYYSLNPYNHPDSEDVILIATKSNAALRDFHRELDEYRLSRMQAGAREILVTNGENIPITHVSWDELVLPDGLADEIRTNVEGFFNSREWYKDLGIPYRRGFLLTGSPGCGKTLTLKALVSNTPYTFITVLNRGGMFAERLEMDIGQAFYLAEKHAPAVVLFEDLDKLTESKHIALSHFLNILDGLKIMDGVLVIATSNDAGRLDPALLHRPSRFDRVWTFPLPAYEQRYALLKKKGARYFSDPAIEEVAHRASGFSMAYVQEIVVNALLGCAHNHVSPKDEHLLKSYKMLKAQRKAASKEEESIADRESIGYRASSRARSGRLLHWPEFNDDDE